MSIRTRLTLQFILIMTSIVIAFGLTIWISTGFKLDNYIESVMKKDATLIEEAGNRTQGGLYGLKLQQIYRFSTEPGVIVQIQDPAGKEIITSELEPQSGLSPKSVQEMNITVNDRIDRQQIGSNNYYVFRHPILSANNSLEGYIVLVSPAEVGNVAIRSLEQLLSPTAAVMIITGGLLVWLLVGRATRPLERLAATAAQIEATSDHSLRLQPERPLDEINQLAHTINGMLQSLEDAYQHVQDVNNQQRHFLADVSHELRTPLTIMLSSLDLLKKERGADPEFQADAINNIRSEAERMTRMVTQLLLLARTDTHATIVREPLLIVDIINDVCRQENSAQNVTQLECRGLGLLEDAVILGNADYLKQLFLILTENAVKYTPDGGKIEITGTLQSNTLTISVTDTGIGIAPIDLPRIFDRFYRADNARFRSGSGLGLPIAQHIVEQHNGRISVESTVGQGSRFTVTLPLLKKLSGSFSESRLQNSSITISTEAASYK